MNLNLERKWKRKSTPLHQSLVKNRNGGYILPLSLFLLLVFTTLTLHASLKYQLEKDFFTDTEFMYQMESLIFLGIKDLKGMSSFEEEKSGTFLYDVGSVKYEVQPTLEEDVYFVQFHCLVNGSTSHYVQFQYNQVTGMVSEFEYVFK